MIAGNSDSEATALIPFGSIFGACLFSYTIILSTVIFLLPNKVLKVKKSQILEPLVCYISGVVFLLLVAIFYKKMNIWLSAILVVFYVMYYSENIDILSWFWRQKERKERSSHQKKIVWFHKFQRVQKITVQSQILAVRMLKWKIKKTLTEPLKKSWKIN